MAFPGPFHLFLKQFLKVCKCAEMLAVAPSSCGNPDQRGWPTLAEDLMPLIIAKATIAQAPNKQPVMMGLNSPDSSMEFVILRAFRNQK